MPSFFYEDLAAARGLLPLPSRTFEGDDGEPIPSHLLPQLVEASNLAQVREAVEDGLAPRSPEELLTLQFFVDAAQPTAMVAEVGMESGQHPTPDSRALTGAAARAERATAVELARTAAEAQEVVAQEAERQRKVCVCVRVRYFVGTGSADEGGGGCRRWGPRRTGPGASDQTGLQITEELRLRTGVL